MTAVHEIVVDTDPSGKAAPLPHSERSAGTGVTGVGGRCSERPHAVVKKPGSWSATVAAAIAGTPAARVVHAGVGGVGVSDGVGSAGPHCTPSKTS